jgi:hypothetical protein
MHMYNIISYCRVLCCSETVFKKYDFLVELVDLSPVGFGRVVFWSSCCLAELLFGLVGFGRPVGGGVDGLPKLPV